MNKREEISKPESVGFDSGKLALIEKRVNADIAAEKYDGARILGARQGQVVLDLTLGYAERAAKRKLEADAEFSIMSISKVMTAVTLLQCVERGELSLQAPVASIIPEFAQRGKSLVTIYQILTHTAGMGMAYAPLPVERLGNLEECVAAICGLPLESTPGEVVSYSASMGFTILAEVVRRLDAKKRPFRAILKEELFQPLGMHDTSMGLTPEIAKRRVPVVVRDKDTPELNPAALLLRDKTVTETSELPSGGATFSTGADVLRFAEALRLGGALEGNRVLSPAMVHMMTRNQTGLRPNTMMNSSRALHGMAPFPAFLGLGCFLRGEGVFPGHIATLASNEAFGGWGLGSMCFWVDPKHDVSFVALTSGLMERIRNLVRFQALGDMFLASLVEP